MGLVTYEQISINDEFIIALILVMLISLLWVHGIELGQKQQQELPYGLATTRNFSGALHGPGLMRQTKFSL